MAVLWLASGLVSGLPHPKRGGSLFAQGAEPQGRGPVNIDPWSLGWHYLVLLGVVLLAILGIYLFMRWWRRTDSDRLSASEQLSEFRNLYERGELSREEFERLRSLLGERMRQEMEGQASAAPGPQPPAAPQGPAPKPEPPSNDGIPPPGTG
jgi:hypothetical protein